MLYWTLNWKFRKCTFKFLENLGKALIESIVRLKIVAFLMVVHLKYHPLGYSSNTYYHVKNLAYKKSENIIITIVGNECNILI